MAKKKNDDEADDLNLEDLKAYSDARLRAIRRAAIEEDKLRNVTLETKSLWDSISYTLLGISNSDFFTKVRESEQDIANNNNLLAEANEIIASMSYSLNNDFTKAITGSKRKLLDLIKSSQDISPDLAKSLREAVKSGNIGDFLQEQGDLGKKALQDLIGDDKGFKKLADFLKKDGEGPTGFIKMINNTKLLEQELKNPTREFINWERILARIGDNIFKIFSPQNLLPVLYEFDQILNTTQREFGINLDANSARFSDLVSNSARFGVSIQENATFMGVLSEHIRSTNPDILLQAANNMMAVKMATGLATEEVANLTGQMMFFGDSSENVYKFIEETSNKARIYGLASKKVLTEVSKALPDARKLGWQGGTKALADMIINAKKLGQSMDELVNAGKKLRSLEGSLEASADLALVGVNTNAIQMLAAARRGGQEFSNFVSNLTNSFGILKKDGTVDFDPIDIDRLQVVADATGVSLEGLQNQISANLKRNEKARLLPAKFFNLNKDEKEFLLNATKLDGTGKIQIAGNINGITEFNKLTPEMIRQMASQKQTLEDQAQGNMSFKESVKGLKETFIHFLTHLQPIVAWLTDGINRLSNWVAGLSSFWKKFTLGFAIFGAMIFSVARHFTNGYAMGQGFNAATTKGGFFDKIKDKIFGKKPEIPSVAEVTRNTIENNNPLSSINSDGAEKASKIKEIFESIPSPAKILAIAAAIVALGFAFVEIGYGIKLASQGLGELTKSFKGVKDSGMALGAVTVVIAGFTGMLAIMIPIIKALGSASISAAPGLIAVGAAIALMGAGIWIASEGLSDLVKSFKDLTGKQAVAAVISLALTMGGFVGIIAIISAELPFLAAGITTIGAAATLGAVGFLVLGAAAIGIGFGMKLASEGIAIIINSLPKLITSFSSLSPLVAEFSKNIKGLAIGLPFIALGIFSLIPAISSLAIVGTLSSVGLLALAFSFGKLWSSMEDVASGTNSINISLTGISKTMDHLKMSIKDVVDSILTLSILKNIIPSLNELTNIKGDGLDNFNSSIKDTTNISTKLSIISNAFALLTGNVKSFIKEFNSASSSLNKGIDVSNVTKSIQKPQSIDIENVDFTKINKNISENIMSVEKLQTKISTFIANLTTYSNSINGIFTSIKEPNIKFEFLNKINIDALSSLVDMMAQYNKISNEISNKTNSDFMSSLTERMNQYNKLGNEISNKLNAEPIIEFINKLNQYNSSINDFSNKINTAPINEFVEKINQYNNSINGFLNKINTESISVFLNKINEFNKLGNDFSNTMKTIENATLSIEKLSEINLNNIKFPDFTLNIEQLKEMSNLFPSLIFNQPQIEPTVFNNILKVKDEISSSINTINTQLSLLNNNALIKFTEGAIQSFESLSNSILNTQEKIQELQKFSLSSIVDVSSLTSLSNTLTSLVDSFKIILTPISIMASSVNSITKSFEKIESIINEIDTSKLNLISDYGSKLTESNRPTNQSTGTQNENEVSKEQKFSIEPITINLKLDGKDIHKAIVEANAYRI